MPIIRKLIQVGASRCVSIPKSWLEYYERELEKPITEVEMEVNTVLKIKPATPRQTRVREE